MEILAFLLYTPQTAPKTVSSKHFSMCLCQLQDCLQMEIHEGLAVCTSLRVENGVSARPGREPPMNLPVTTRRCYGQCSKHRSAACVSNCLQSATCFARHHSMGLTQLVKPWLRHSPGPHMLPKQGSASHRHPGTGLIGVSTKPEGQERPRDDCPLT
jgi:hypothetical protein